MDCESEHDEFMLKLCWYVACLWILFFWERISSFVMKMNPPGKTKGLPCLCHSNFVLPAILKKFLCLDCHTYMESFWIAEKHVSILWYYLSHFGYIFFHHISFYGTDFLTDTFISFHRYVTWLTIWCAWIAEWHYCKLSKASRDANFRIIGMSVNMLKVRTISVSIVRELSWDPTEILYHRYRPLVHSN